MPRMAKYFALSALAHAVILFAALDLMIAQKVQKKEIGTIFRVGLKELAGGGAFSSQTASVADAVGARREQARRIEASRSQSEASRLARIQEQAERRKLHASLKKMQRPATEEKVPLTRPDTQTRQLSTQELRDLVEEFDQAQRSREEKQTDPQHATQTPTNHRDRPAAMTHEQREALAREAERPRTSQAEKHAPKPDAPALSAAAAAARKTIELESVLAMDDLKVEEAAAAAPAGGDAPGSRSVEATHAAAGSTTARTAHAGAPVAHAQPRVPSGTAKPASPSPARVVEPGGKSSPSGRQSMAMSLDMPAEEFAASGAAVAQQAPAAAGSGGPRASQVQVQHPGGGSSEAQDRSSPSAAVHTAVEARQSELGRPASSAPALASPLASSARPSGERSAPALGIQAPDETPTTDPLIRMPGGAGQGPPTAEARPITVQHAMPGGGPPASQRGTAPAGGRALASPRAPDPAGAATSPAAGLLAALSPSDAPPAQRRSPGVSLPGVTESIAEPGRISAPAERGAGGGTMARAIPSSRVSSAPGAGKARSASAAERAGSGAPLAEPTVASRGTASTPVPPVAGAAAAKADAALDTRMPDEGQLVATRYREVGGGGAGTGARAIVTRWDGRGNSESRSAPTAQGHVLEPGASTAARPTGDSVATVTAIGVGTTASGARRAAALDGAAPEEALTDGPRAAESRGAGIAAGAVSAGRATAGPSAARSGHAGARAAVGPRTAPVGPRTPSRTVAALVAQAGTAAVRGASVDLGGVQAKETFDEGPRIGEARGDGGPAERTLAVAHAGTGARPAPQRDVRAATPDALQPRTPNVGRTLNPSAAFHLLPGLTNRGHGSGVVIGAAGGAETTLKLTTIQYGGAGADWDTHTSMMDFLGFQLRKRIGFNIETKLAVKRLDSPDIMKSPWLYMSGHKDFRFTRAQADNLRRYLRAGGTLWADDSTHENDFTWDKAFRREIARVLSPRQGFAMRKIAKADDHPLFRTCFDLSEGFAGYFPPPGDKYRQNFIEGIEVDGRLAVIYTRNDYGDGLEIQPDTHPLKASLSGLSPAEMQESSFLMATNIIVYALTGGEADRGILARAAASLKNNREAMRDREDSFADLPATPFENFEGENWMTEEGWDLAGPAKLGYALRPRGEEGRRLAVKYRLGDDEKKVVLIRELPDERDLSGQERCYIDVDSKLSGIARMSVAIITMPDWKYFESRPAHIKPGSNRVFFELQKPTWKTGERVPDGQSEYRSPITNLDATRRFVIVLYPLQRGGTVLIDNIEFKTQR
ncbi:DUF4159 domain-containing protein [bacterium]|nr:DUF4159 domain-containing protein [bacterium]